VSLELFGHPFSSYTWKVLIALWADETPSVRTIPLLVDGDRSVVEATWIVEHLQAHHPGPNRWIPDGGSGAAFASSTACLTSA